MPLLSPTEDFTLEVGERALNHISESLGRLRAVYNQLSGRGAGGAGEVGE
jgi:hypothetical protein